MSTDLAAVLRNHELLIEIAEDPDLDRDSKLFALCLLSVLAERTQPARRKRTGDWMVEVSRRAGYGDSLGWVRQVISHDVPRYKHEEPPGGDVIRCQAPMIRRDGPCGKRATSVWLEHQPDTGAAQYVGFCKRHITTEREQQGIDSYDAWVANGKPSPPPNAGGVLPRYFETDWAALYAWAAGQRADSTKQRSTPPPTLIVINGGGHTTADTAGPAAQLTTVQ